MMKLTAKNLEKAGWLTNRKTVEFKAIFSDTRELRKDTAFLMPWLSPGSDDKGIQLLHWAQEARASVIFCPASLAEKAASVLPDAENLLVSSSDYEAACGRLMKLIHDAPDDKLTLTGVTGTNGKTTITKVLFDIASRLKMKSVYTGTLGWQTSGKNLTSTGYTSPPVGEFYGILAQAVKSRAVFGFHEVSSHALNEGRTAGVNWDIAIFTNLTPEHMDYHADLEDYFRVKKKLFLSLLEQKSGPRLILICNDDPYGAKLADQLRPLVEAARGVKMITIGRKGDFTLKEIIPDWKGYRASVVYRDREFELATSLLGGFNIINMAMVQLALEFLKVEEKKIRKAILEQHAPEGRMNVISGPNGRKIVIDYAHTPDALENCLITLQELNPIRIVCVFGCGGDRDAKKRPLMGKTASTRADFVILTNDNPRNEDPQRIVDDIKAGLEHSNFIVIFDRARAIRAGMQILGVQEVLLIAGKGHETAQIIGDKVTSFSDAKTVKAFLKEVEYE